MRVKRLALTNFRSYKDLDLEFAPGPTTFIGNNGSGKTNIAESLIYLAYLSSHRVSTNQPLLALGSDQTIIRAEIERDNRSLQVDLEINASKANRARLNGNPVKSQREILGALQIVYFSPEDLDLVRGEPTDRRNFLDKLLITQTPRLAGVISDYERALKQRNSLLKSRAPQSSLSPWDEHLAVFGGEVIAGRLKLIAEIEPLFQTAYKNLSEKKVARLGYKSSVAGADTDKEENKKKTLSTMTEISAQERDRGVSLIGPHRDDLILQLGDFPAKGYASHGESWSFAISLKIASLELLKTQGLDPILILDDVFAELDNNRRARLVQATKLAEQTIVTAAVEGDLPADLNDTRFHVSNGKVIK